MSDEAKGKSVRRILEIPVRLSDETEAEIQSALQQIAEAQHRIRSFLAQLEKRNATEPRLLILVNLLDAALQLAYEKSSRSTEFYVLVIGMVQALRTFIGPADEETER